MGCLFSLIKEKSPKSKKHVSKDKKRYMRESFFCFVLKEYSGLDQKKKRIFGKVFSPK